MKSLMEAGKCGCDSTKMMNPQTWHIYIGEIPYCEKGAFWVSFESDPQLKKTRADIYGRCLPCIQHLYEQLRVGAREIDLGNAFHCWKVTTVLPGMDECLSLLSEFERMFPGGHVYGKMGTGRPFSSTKVVVFHARDKTAADHIEGCLKTCLSALDQEGEVMLSRACAVLYEDILGDWRKWQPVTPMEHPERAGRLLERIRKTLFWSSM